MDNFKYVNAGQSTLASSIVAADTSLTVANAARFPSSLSGGEILVLTLHPSGLESTQEIVLCTSIAAGVMTVTRGAQGTTAQDWPSGTVVGAYLTGEMLGQIRDVAISITGTNTGDETATRIGAIVNGATAKTAPVDADLLALADSAASNVVKKLSWANAKATLKTYFDTLYNKYVHPNHSGDVTSVADGATTIAANAVSNTKLSDMANATIKGRLTSGAGDPEDLTATQVRTLINVANGAQKNSDILKSEIEAKLTGEITSHTHPVVDTVPAGLVAFYPKTTAPAGWIKANGADISRTTYSALFAAIGTTFGAGNGTTTFNVPDLRGEFIQGLDDGRGVDTGRTLSNTSQASQNKSHSHTTDSKGEHTHNVITRATDGGGYPAGVSYVSSGGVATPVVANAAQSAGAHTHTLSTDGGTEARPRNIALLACIKY